MGAKRLLPCLTALLVVAIPAPAHATWPGKPGKIAYYALSAPEDGIYGIRADGLRNRRIVGVAGGDAAWSRSGGRIAYFRDGLELWEARSDGTHPKRVLSLEGQPGYGSDPAWSPSGKQLVFTVAREFEGDDDEGTTRPTRHDLYVVDRDGTGLRKLTRGHDATWSSRNRIAYASEGGAVLSIGPNGRWRQIWVPQGSPAQVTGLDYSPDGLKLVYLQSTRIATKRTIRTIDLGTGRRTSFPAQTPKANALDVSWAPRGHRIAYVHHGGTDAVRPDEFRTILPSGRGRKTLFEFRAGAAVFDFAWQTR